MHSSDDADVAAVANFRHATAFLSHSAMPLPPSHVPPATTPRCPPHMSHHQQRHADDVDDEVEATAAETGGFADTSPTRRCGRCQLNILLRVCHLANAAMDDYDARGGHADDTAAATVAVAVVAAPCTSPSLLLSPCGDV